MSQHFVGWTGAEEVRAPVNDGTLVQYKKQGEGFLCSVELLVALKCIYIKTVQRNNASEHKVVN